MKRYTGSVSWVRRAEQPQADVPAGAELETATPTRPASFTSDLIVPLGQAGVTGALVGALVVFALGEVKPGWDVDPFKVWAGVSLFCAAVAWLLLLMDTRRLLWTVERLTGLDLDRDGMAGKPRERVVFVNAGQGQPGAAPQADRQSNFARFVAGIPVKGTGMRIWESELGRETYQEYRDALIRLGWARWTSTKEDGTPNERQGWELVKPAAEILERIGG